MKTGAGISGGAHLALLGLAVISGVFDQDTQATPVAIAEISLMTGAEFEAATSAAPNFDANRVAAPEAPTVADERADVTVAEVDAAPTTNAAPTAPDTPEQGEDVQAPNEAPARPNIADVGTREAAPLAPEADAIVAPSDPVERLAPEALAQVVPKPAARPGRVAVDTSTPEPEPTPEPKKAEEPKPVEKAEAPKPPTPPASEPETETGDEATEPLNDPSVAAPNVAPPPPKKPRDVAEAKQAERLARPKAAPKESGATKKADAPASTASTRTVGELSFRDKDSLRVGIRGYFSPPRGLPNEDKLFVKLRIELSAAGRITGGPTVLEPGGRLDAGQAALMRAGVRALKKSEAAGVFQKLPKDKHSRWRIMNVIFTPKEIRFL